jgi:MFS transporter, ACS family, tartrate transporter
MEEDGKRGTFPVSATRALVHGRVWHLACIAFTLATALYIASFWMPQIVKALSSGSSNTVVGLLVMVPNVVGLLLMIVISRNSDRTQERRWHARFPHLPAVLPACCSVQPIP